MSSDGSSDQASKDNTPSVSTTTTKKRPRSTNKRLRDTNAPVQPASGYIRFMMARRPQVVQEHPDLSHIEIAKLVGAEWKALSVEEKETFNTKAAADRTEYLKELSAYKKTDLYKQFRKKLKKQVESGFDDQNPEDQFDIPIFSKEFLEINRKRESELRRLRMEVVRLEEEQVALDSNIVRLKKATEQLETEMKQQNEVSDKLRSQLDSYRRALVQAFAHMPFPGTTVVPTIGTIDNYMSNIHKLVLESPGEHQDFVAKIRDIVTKLKMPSA